MLSDKVPDRGQVIPPQKRPPRDLLKVYGLVGGVLGIFVVAVVRNCFRLPDLVFPFLLWFNLGELTITFSLQDVLLGAIVGSTLGAYVGRKAQDREDKKNFRERHPEFRAKPD